MSHFYLPIHEDRIREVYKRLPHEIILESVPLEAVYAVTPEPVVYAKRKELSYAKINEGTCWGRRFDCGWFHLTGKIPASWKGAYVTLNLDFGGEALLYDAKGCPLVALTDGSTFAPGYTKDMFHFLKSAKGGEKVDFWVETGANNLFGLHISPDSAWNADGEAPHGEYNAALRRMRAVRFDYTAWQLWLDLDVILSLLQALPEKSSRRIQVVRATSRALDMLPPERGGAEAVRKALAKTVFAVAPDPASVNVTAIGHAHIDTMWLWPERETVRKVARTFASQIGLIERYPGYKFGASQAQLYLFLKENYPQLWEKVRKAVANGDWEVQGGMWVEADCNLPSGESLIRQFLLGERFFRDELGVIPNNLWLPDVFGYSGNLPQILNECGIEFFLTQKLSWNRYNQFPHNSFVWEGIDGSRVVSHFPPEDTYNANLYPSELKKHETNNREAGIVDVAISLFGMGDGGGGPKEEHIERGLRCRKLNGCPPVRFGFAQKAMDEIKKQERDLDVWNGELYFEFHRGTLTTQARQKRLNRRCEEALRAAEMLAAAAGVAGYPAEKITALWRTICLCQFHDIIPGSSIARVYKECGEKLDKVLADAAAISAKAAANLLEPAKDSMAVFNPSSTAFDGFVELPKGYKSASQGGEEVPVQTELDGVVRACIHVEPTSFATLTLSKKGGETALCEKLSAKDTKVILENELVSYELNANCQVVRAFDKETGREFICAAEPANVIRLYDDHPHTYDAWDFDEYALDMPVATATATERVFEAGCARQVLTAKIRIGSSTGTQRIILAAGSKRLDFETVLDWREKHKLCRVDFPVEVRSETARYEIQYGTIARATHDNTKREYAQFESCGHRYADLSDNQFGVALLNNCKYGYRVKGSTLSLSLLRAPTYPDPFADEGEQRFTYAVLPHAGTLAQTDAVVKSAAELNQSVVLLGGFRTTERSHLPVEIEGEGVELAVLKKAEDSDALVVRVVERRGCNSQFTLKAPGKTTATRCLATELANKGRAVKLPAKIKIRPFEIMTLRLD